MPVTVDTNRWYVIDLFGHMRYIARIVKRHDANNFKRPYKVLEGKGISKDMTLYKSEIVRQLTTIETIFYLSSVEEHL